MDGTNMPSELAKEYAKRKFRRWLFKLVLSNTPLLIILLVVIVAALYDLGELDTTANNDNNSDVIVETVECGFTISSTALSKQEFKEKIKNFASKNSNFKIFYENAYGIYEYAKSKNVNPELVVIRAYVEGRGKTTGKYNYWGMGCTNTGGIKACFNYTSFDDGYTDYINNISKYKSLEEMMGKYSYIGKYWYNPGSSSIGGCYYAKYIYTETNMPDRVKNACSSSAPSCTQSNTSKCTKTTPEDQTAYAIWQVEKNMTPVRELIFGLGSDEGTCTINNDNINNKPETETTQLLASTPTLGRDHLNKLDRPLTAEEVEELNKYIYARIEEFGYGTSEGVAAAGVALIQGLSSKGYYLPYYYGGGHCNKIGDMNCTFVGVNPNWGSSKFGYDFSKYQRKILGLDCSAFVSWAIRTACAPEKFQSERVGYYIQEDQRISPNEATPGDVVVKKGSHIKLVVKNNNDGTLIVAESAGRSGKIDISALVFTQHEGYCTGNKTDNCYVIYDMEKYYKNNCTLTSPN